MIKIYYTYFKEQLSEPSFGRYLDCLPHEMQKKIMRFRFWQDSQASLFGKLLLSRGLADLGLFYHLSEIKYTSYGRPYFSNGIDFNISHSGGFIACAFTTTGKIGIDIEEVRPISIQDFRNIFHDDEWNDITTSSHVEHVFFHYWTIKEAIVKADGKGLNIPLKKIFVKNEETVLDGAVWYYQNISLQDNYIVKIASDKQLKNVESIQLKF